MSRKDPAKFSLRSLTFVEAGIHVWWNPQPLNNLCVLVSKTNAKDDRCFDSVIDFLNSRSFSLIFNRFLFICEIMKS